MVAGGFKFEASLGHIHSEIMSQKLKKKKNSLGYFTNVSPFILKITANTILSFVF
jgi:hypothetical protein